jgi:hypothetical protein
MFSARRPQNAAVGISVPAALVALLVPCCLKASALAQAGNFDASGVHVCFSLCRMIQVEVHSSGVLHDTLGLQSVFGALRQKWAGIVMIPQAMLPIMEANSRKRAEPLS